MKICCPSIKYFRSGEKLHHIALFSTIMLLSALNWKNMSSNISLPKFCEYCGASFIAKQVRTQYCSHACASRAYKQRKRESKVLNALTNEINKQKGSSSKAKSSTLPLQIGNHVNLRDKDFLSVIEASILLGVSRWTIQRLIKQEKIFASKIGRRTIIKRTEIDKLFNVLE